MRPDVPGVRVPARPDAPATGSFPRRPDRHRPGVLGWVLILIGISTGVATAAANLDVLSEAARNALSSTGPVVLDPAPESRDPGEEESDDYSFIRESGGGKPWRWNPCEPIHYIVNLEDAPPETLADVQEAIDRVEEAAGVRFAFDGYTDEVPSPFRFAFQPKRYGGEWAPS